MLEGLLQGVGERVFARLGAAAFLFAAVLVVVSEAETMARGPSGPSEAETLLLHRMYAGTALLAQASFGAALLRTTLLPKWIGWTVIGWNISWLLALPLINVLAGNPGYYYPVLHHFMPFLVGVALLRRPSRGASPR